MSEVDARRGTGREEREYKPLLVLFVGALRLDGLCGRKGRSAVCGHSSVGLGWAVRWQVCGVGHAQTGWAGRERLQCRRRRLVTTATVIADGSSSVNDGGEGCDVRGGRAIEGEKREREREARGRWRTGRRAEQVVLMGRKAGWSWMFTVPIARAQATIGRVRAR